MLTHNIIFPKVRQSHITLILKRRRLELLTALGVIDNALKKYPSERDKPYYDKLILESVCSFIGFRFPIKRMGNDLTN